MPRRHAVAATPPPDARAPPPRPGPLGRLVRVVLGLAILYGVVELVGAFEDLRAADAPPTDPGFLLFILLGLWAMRYVLDIGLGVRMGPWSLVVVLSLALLLAVMNLVRFGQAWGPALAVFTTAWLLLVFVPLGVAFLLAAALATPGCEMRSYAHLKATLTGTDPRARFCPGFIDRLDRVGAKPPRTGAA